MSTGKWTRLIRFVAQDGQTYFGQPTSVDSKGYLPSGIKARVITGNPLGSYKITDQVVEVKTLLAPLERVPIFICIGLNYRKHAAEAGMPTPPHPIIFTKPSMAAAGPDEAVRIPKVAQDKSADFEAELGVVIGKTCRNVSEQDALQYVAGYTVCNDISARKWQRSTSQWTFGKSFDTFGPYGPQIVSTSEIADAGTLDLKLRLNGKELQNSNTSDLIFNIRQIIAHCSKGTTLEAGTVIMTGTPEGVGMARKPPVYMKDGDILETEIEKIGILRNKIQHE
ncbi:hypothetical protein SmJEL517_g02590 [Synchytrium microbalum]|uniref:Fumarylacetoacetase-like C-terminal domain-containing protein n=1 Tax=Synchytrium microbalum TaxID=1806994 RepID=A0A507CAA1_9FUNG|nr:uncharacterized protein SmJEL517_g02590 [Synchytrium microbalum]TPX34926.1 hypothetical protein SmJEL517_g02590 [Synchytrium microbalum]